MERHPIGKRDLCCRRRSRPSRQAWRQRGQALTEMAILAAVLVPLFLLIPTLSKYFHMKQTAQQAARSAAWNATVVRDYDWAQLDAAQQRRLVLDRHFGQASDPIRTQAAQDGEDSDVRSEMMNSFSNRALLRRRDVTLSPYVNESGGRVDEVIDQFGRMIELLQGEFPPNSGGLVTSEMVLRPRNLMVRDGGPARFLDPFHAIDLEMRVKHTVLADAWNAAGNGLEGTPSHNRSRSVHSQVESLAQLSMFAPVADTLEDLEFLDVLPVLGVISRFRPGYIQPDIVPKDKLETYRPR